MQENVVIRHPWLVFNIYLSLNRDDNDNNKTVQKIHNLFKMAFY